MRKSCFFRCQKFVAAALVLASAAYAKTDRFNCDVVVVDSSVGGVMAAVEAASRGAKVCLSSATDWLGGQFSTQGVCAVDAPHNMTPVIDVLKTFVTERTPTSYKFATNGLVPAGEYATAYDDVFVNEAMKCLMPLMKLVPDRANCWVSHDCCRPSSADQAFKSLLDAYVRNGQVRIFYETVPTKVTRADDGSDAILSVSFVRRHYSGKGAAPYAIPLSSEITDWYDPDNSPRYKKSSLVLRGKIFVDGTETGEIMALSGAHHTLGEVDAACAETPESQGENVMAFVDPMNLSTQKPTVAVEGALDAMIHDHCPELNTDATTLSYEQEYFYVDWAKYPYWPRAGKLALVNYRKISNDPEVTMMNFGQSLPVDQRASDKRGANDYSFGNFIIPRQKLGDQLKNWRGGVRVEELRKAECHAWAFAKWLMHEKAVVGSAPRGKGVTPIFDLAAADNFFGTGTALSKMPYVRDTRHLVGYGGFCMDPQRFTTQFADFAAEPNKKLTLAHFRDSKYYARSNSSIGIADYTLDARKFPNGKSPSITDVSDLRLTEIPLEAAVSENIPNLMAAGKNIAVHQIVGSAARTHPFECNVGKGVGAAAAFAVAQGIDMHEIMKSPAKIRAIQRNIIEDGGTTGWFENRLMPAE